MKYLYWFFEDVFSKEKIIEINNFVENNFDFYEKDSDVAKEKGISKKNANVKSISYLKIEKYIGQTINFCFNVNKKYFGYDLDYECMKQSYCNLNTYLPNNSPGYGWHVDGTEDPYQDIKLTVLINLSMTQYEGGKFILFEQEEMEVHELNQPGKIIMFRSNINHMVTPVTFGERRTLTIFLTGPNFK